MGWFAFHRAAAPWAPPKTARGKSRHITQVRGAGPLLGSFALVTPKCNTPASSHSPLLGILSKSRRYQCSLTSAHAPSLPFFVCLMSHLHVLLLFPFYSLLCVIDVVSATVWGKGHLGLLGSVPISPLRCSVVLDASLYCSAQLSVQPWVTQVRSLHSYSSCLALTLSTTFPVDASSPLITLFLHH